MPDSCPVLGVHLDYLPGKGSFAPRSPSLDRIDPAGGYTRDNVRVISMRANILKRDASIEEMEKVIAYMRRMRPVASAAQ